MKPVEFKESNAVFAKDHPSLLPFPVYKYENDPQGTILACWQLSFRERVKILFTGRVWHWINTFNEPLQPQAMQVDDPFSDIEDDVMDGADETGPQA